VKKSAGILLFKEMDGELFVFLVHPGGPFWKTKDHGAWSIPKGEFTDEEEALVAARREFQEETGYAVDGAFIELNPVKQKSSKTIFPFALASDVDPAGVVSNEFEIEWPPRSGRRQRFPEIDKAGWFDLDEAMKRMQAGQVPILLDLMGRLGVRK
jgi:predicted NUDIX family NTP pyrophosphohydrolase